MENEMRQHMMQKEEHIFRAQGNRAEMRTPNSAERTHESPEAFLSLLPHNWKRGGQLHYSSQSSLQWSMVCKWGISIRLRAVIGFVFISSSWNIPCMLFHAIYGPFTNTARQFVLLHKDLLQLCQWNDNVSLNSK